MQAQRNKSFEEVISPRLGADDDPAFWREAMLVLASDIEAEIAEGRPKCGIILEVGACSQWLRPHQTRWKASGGFAWPTGYGGGIWSRMGLPQYDWSVKFEWDANSEDWNPIGRISAKRKLGCRIAFPTRTAKHNQAAIHTAWEPGAPTSPKMKCVRFYGFRKNRTVWKCAAKKEFGETENHW